jgi:RNA polymerase sigma-70 factor, ECF subfamily
LTEVIERQLERAKQGDSEALSVLYQRFMPGIFSYIAMRVPTRTLAEDLTSEVFLEMVESIHQLRANDEASFIAWLLRIARVVVAGYYRKQERQPALLPLHTESWENGHIENLATMAGRPESDPIYLVEAREEWQMTVNAMNALTEEQRQVLVGRLILGYDVATVARMIGKKANAVKALQFRALHSLQRLLEKQENPAPVRRGRKEDRR